MNKNSRAFGSEPVDATAKLFFQGGTACGPVGLTLAREAEAEGEGAAGVEQVLRLAQAEPLISAVEQWLRSDWDPAPCGGGNEAMRDGYQIMVRNPALAPPGTLLHLPLEALRTPPPDILCAPALTWTAQPADLTLDNVPTSVLDQLEPGALVLLPRAFSPKWVVSLCDPSGRLPTCSARLDLVAQKLVEVAAKAAAAGAPPDAGDAQLLVRLTQRVMVPLDHWMGFGSATMPFHWPVPQPWAVQLCRAGITHGRGALLPLGQGYGMLLESVEAPPA